MFQKTKKNNQGTALILTILIAGVLFALSSFLISQVLINTKIVEKATSDEENYSLAKVGILYAIDRLNNWPGQAPNYDSTDWPGNANWNEYDIDQSPEHPGNDVRIRVRKNVPSSNYITIESQDIQKKVTLQAIADYKSPLTKYVRLIGSNTTFGNNTFGPSGSNAIIQGTTTNPTPFCILGDLTWENGGTNNLFFTGNKKAIVYGKIASFDETSTSLKINGNLPHSGYHYYTDPSEPSNSKLFDTAEGSYFDQAHLPCCFDYSSGDPTFQYGDLRSIFWPKIINEEKGGTIYSNKYENLAKLNGIYIGANAHPDESSNWYNCSSTGWEETYTDSGTYFYTGTGTLVVLDGNGKTSGTPGQVGIDDGTGGAIAGNDIIEDSEWRPYPSNGLIYSPGNLRILGMIGDDVTPQDYNLTIVSGGTIYIEGNLIKGTDNSSLALLAKDWVALNPTHKFTGGKVTEMESEYYDSTGGDIDWSFRPDAPGNSWGTKLSATTQEELYTIAVFNLGHLVLANRVTLKDLILKADWELRIYVSLNKECERTTVENEDTQFGDEYATPVSNVTVDFDHTGGSPVSFQYIKIWLHTTSSTAPTPFQVNSIIASLIGGGGDGTYNGKPLVNGLFYAQEQSWAVISGDGAAVPPYPIVIGGCIAENKQEQSSNWSNWSAINPDTGKPYITYIYDSDISSNHLPSSVNLISLKRE